MTKFEFDLTPLMEMLQDCDLNQHSEIVRKATVAAGKVIVEGAKNNIASDRKVGYNPKYSDTVLDGYIVKGHTEDIMHPYAVVSALGTQKKGSNSGSFRTRFLDGGAKLWNGGEIVSGRYLENSITANEGAAYERLKEVIFEELNKINNKNYD